MAFIIPVIRRDFPIYNIQHSPNSLVLQKRRSESMPINFYADHPPSPAAPPTKNVKGGNESNNGMINRCQSFQQQFPRNQCSSDNPCSEMAKIMTNIDQQDQQQKFSVPNEQFQQQPLSMTSRSTKHNQDHWEWLFPNKRVSFTLLDDGDDDTDDDDHIIVGETSNRCQGRRRRVRFGMCERVEYDRNDSHQRQLGTFPEGKSESQNVSEPTSRDDTTIRYADLQSGIDECPTKQQKPRSISSGRMRAASIPAQHLIVMRMPRPVRRVRTMSSPPAMISMGEKKENAKKGNEDISNEMTVCIRNGKCNFVLLRLLSSIRNSSRM